MPCRQCGRKPAYAVKYIPDGNEWIGLTETMTLWGSCVAKLRDERNAAIAEHRRREGEVGERASLVQR